MSFSNPATPVSWVPPNTDEGVTKKVRCVLQSHSEEEGEGF